MRKTFLGIGALVLTAALLFGGCGEAVTNAISDTVDGAANAIAEQISPNVTGEVGKTYATQWFEFTIKSAAKVDSYAGYTAVEGYELVDVVVVETNTFDDSIPMGLVDFYMDEETFVDYCYPLDPIDDTMMPDMFELAPGDTAEYHMVFEVPEGYSKMNLIYIEYAEGDVEGATFTIAINV